MLLEAIFLHVAMLLLETMLLLEAILLAAVLLTDAILVLADTVWVAHPVFGWWLINHAAFLSHPVLELLELYLIF